MLSLSVRLGLKAALLAAVATQFSGDGSARAMQNPAASSDPVPSTRRLSPPGEASERFPFEVGFFETAYPEKFEVDLKAKGPGTLSGDEEFLRRFFLTNASGKPEEILALWSEADRKTVQQMMQDKEISGPSQAYYRQARQIRFLRKIHFGSYRLVLLEITLGDSHEPSRDIYVIRQVGDKVFATNALQDDPTRAFIEHLLRTSPSREASR